MKKYCILLPCEYNNLKEVDSSFKNELNAIKLNNIEYILFDFDLFIKDKVLKLNKNIDFNDYLCIYRGWMMKSEQYEYFNEQLYIQNRLVLINTPTQYYALHYYPIIYSQLLTSELIDINNTINKILYVSFTFNNNIITSDNVLIDLYKQIDLEKQYIIKDYCKSEKGTDCFILTNDDTKNYESFLLKIKKFIELRGKLFTGGIVLKEFVNLKLYNNIKNEYRIFILNNTVLTIT